MDKMCFIIRVCECSVRVCLCYFTRNCISKTCGQQFHSYLYVRVNVLENAEDCKHYRFVEHFDTDNIYPFGRLYRWWCRIWHSSLCVYVCTFFLIYFTYPSHQIYIFFFCRINIRQALQSNLRWTSLFVCVNMYMCMELSVSQTHNNWYHKKIHY